MLPVLLPGQPAHQALLRAVADHYADDPRVRAVCVFGSLSRGNWDAFSDLDLDVVVADGLALDPAAELARLCAAFAPLGEAAALIIPTSAEAGDVVLRSGRQLSVRYHPLAATSPHIVDTLLCLTGTLDLSTIIAAGRANAEAAQGREEPARRLLDHCVRYALEVDAALQRGRPWTALELLHRMRALLMTLYGRARGRPRPEGAFQAEASPALQAALAAGVPAFEAAAMRAALDALLDFLEHHLDALTAGQVTLSEEQRALMELVRASDA